MMTRDTPDYDSFVSSDDGTYPNNADLPLVVLPRVFLAEPAVDPAVEQVILYPHSSADVGTDARPQETDPKWARIRLF
jgi:hypothetical protein